MSTGIESKPERTWLPPLLFLGALLPALVAVLPLTMGPVWYLTADENEPHLATATVLWMLVTFTVGVAPFVAGLVALLAGRASGATWSASCRLAAWWTLGLGCESFMWVGLYSAGF